MGGRGAVSAGCAPWPWLRPSRPRPPLAAEEEGAWEFGITATRRLSAAAITTRRDAVADRVRCIWRRDTTTNRSVPLGVRRLDVFRRRNRDVGTDASARGAWGTTRAFVPGFEAGAAWKRFDLYVEAEYVHDSSFYRDRCQHHECLSAAGRCADLLIAAGYSD